MCYGFSLVFQWLSAPGNNQLQIHKGEDTVYASIFLTDSIVSRIRVEENKLFILTNTYNYLLFFNISLRDNLQIM